ncbi:PTS sugar transporter subunit IIA [Caproiciproducens sp. MSJ-32]|uniref:PTS sugar transporter subunit IIA n=1 Tax=Caproiciproducens sp. MSJ-32 TaxID=2841527 RepID=UPI001C10F84F|nr:PTS sugar transporter subunit IIA [Caproiciproducens sp. MSJ-32]MBU5454747.1 PTS sugar transporter subunit IIA [Caproiciproducens sp. MSJ-32]
MIEKLLNSDLVEVDVEAKNWEEAVRAAGLVLLKNNKIKKDYIEAMVNTVKEMGAYIVMARGIAMPHGRPEDGVIENSLSIVKLKKPVIFGNGDFDPVTLVFAICSKDNKCHIDFLKDLSLIFDDETLLEKVSNSKNKEELKEVILEIYKGSML